MKEKEFASEENKESFLPDSSSIAFPFTSTFWNKSISPDYWQLTCRLCMPLYNDDDDTCNFLNVSHEKVKKTRRFKDNERDVVN